MNKEKLLKYHLTASIHTLAIKSDDEVLEGVSENVLSCISASQSKVRGEDKKESRIIINPNKYCGDLYDHKSFQDVMDKIMSELGISAYQIIRADMRFDSFDSEHYKEFAKLNRYIISALAVTYSVQNCYRSTDLFSQEQLSVAIKNRYMECENYDKFAQSNGTDVAMSRLEERSKFFKDNSLVKEFVIHWFERWDKSIENLQQVHERYNNELERIYREQTDSYPIRFNSVNEFLRQYQDCIFCKAQLIDLLSRIEPANYQSMLDKAENFKKRNGVEFYSYNDVKYVVQEIRRATLEFFDI